MTSLFFRVLGSAVVAVGLLCAPPVSAQQTLRFGHSSQIAEPNHVLGTAFAERLAKQTGNKLDVKIYPQAQLGDEKALVEQLRLGTVDATVVASDILVGFVPDFAAIGLPFAFTSYPHAHKFLDGKGGKLLLSKLEAIGVKGLGFIDTGFRSVGNNIRPIRTPDDLQGMKIRVIPSPLVIDTQKAMGSSPVPIPWAETVSALKQGIVDGVETGNSYYYTARLWEYTKNFSYTNHLYTANVVLMSKRTFDRLSKDHQQAVLTAAAEAIPVARKYVADLEAKIAPDLEAKGIKVNTVDPAPFRAKVQVIWEKFAPTISQDVMGELKAVMAAK
jgi:tripartite ATP-independent transporter DctP family solute receptor